MDTNHVVGILSDQKNRAFHNGQTIQVLFTSCSKSWELLRLLYWGIRSLAGKHLFTCPERFNMGCQRVRSFLITGLVTTEQSGTTLRTVPHWNGRAKMRLVSRKLPPLLGAKKVRNEASIALLSLFEFSRYWEPFDDKKGPKKSQSWMDRQRQEMLLGQLHWYPPDGV